jgi:hypothetical protein
MNKSCNDWHVWQNLMINVVRRADPEKRTREELPKLMVTYFYHNNETLPPLFLSQETMMESLDIPESLDHTSVRDFGDLEADVEAPLARYPPPLDPPEINVDDDIEQRSTVAPLEKERKQLVFVECVGCLDAFDENQTHACSGTSTIHHFCNDCYMGYLKAEIQPGGAFAAIRHRTGESESDGEVLTSQPGELPCPFFVTGQCNCTSMPLDDVGQLFETAIRRLTDVDVDVNRRPLEDRTQGGHESDNSAQQVFCAVAQAIQEGSWMRCPLCNLPGIKDEGCMHIYSCAGPGCSANWCYCCGRHRRRNQTEDCRGCDTNAIFIEYQPGWEEYAELGRPVAGIAALNEFHRRRIRYYMQRIKEETSPELWQQFRQSYPDILTGVPTEGMAIEWDELNHVESSRPPVFGKTTEEDLMWKLPPRAHSPPDRPPQTQSPQDRPPGTQSPQERRSGTQSPQGQPRTQYSQEPIPSLRSWNEVLRSRGGLLWISCALLTVSLFLVRWFRFDNASLKSMTSFILSITLYGGISFCLLRVADYNEVQTACNN